MAAAVGRILWFGTQTASGIFTVEPKLNKYHYRFLDGAEAPGRVVKSAVVGAAVFVHAGVVTVERQFHSLAVGKVDPSSRFEPSNQ